jgi:DNA-binding MarR family transcriptional regulator
MDDFSWDTYLALRVEFRKQLRIASRALLQVGVNVAGYEVLYALSRRGDTARSHRVATKAELLRMLEVTAPALNRTLRSLEAWKLVERKRLPSSREQMVSITTEGLRVYRLARESLKRVGIGHVVPLTGEDATAPADAELHAPQLLTSSPPVRVVH